MEIRNTLGNATMAQNNMSIEVDGKKIVKSIFELLEENRTGIEKANGIDVKNSNGFKIDFEVLKNLKDKIEHIEDQYRKVISLYKNSSNYLEGKQTDNIGTICTVYDGNTYCMLEIILKSILTHNAIILVSDSNYMQATNELIVILIKRILEVYGVDKNLVQIIYTSNFEELLSNNMSINKVIAIGNKDFQNRIKEISRIEVIAKGYNNFDIYIENDDNLDVIKQYRYICKKRSKDTVCGVYRN